MLVANDLILIQIPESTDKQHLMIFFWKLIPLAGRYKEIAGANMIKFCICISIIIYIIGKNVKQSFIKACNL